MDETTARQWPKATSLQELAIANLFNKFPEEKQLRGITLMRGILLESTPEPPTLWEGESEMDFTYRLLAGYLPSVMPLNASITEEAILAVFHAVHDALVPPVPYKKARVEIPAPVQDGVPPTTPAVTAAAAAVATGVQQAATQSVSLMMSAPTPPEEKATVTCCKAHGYSWPREVLGSMRLLYPHFWLGAAQRFQSHTTSFDSWRTYLGHFREGTVLQETHRGHDQSTLEVIEGWFEATYSCTLESVPAWAIKQWFGLVDGCV
jgi:hypothetical protein